MKRKSVLTIAVLTAAVIATGVWFNTSRGGGEPADAARGGGGEPADAARSARAGRAGDGAPVSVMTAVATKEDVPVRKRAIGFVETPASVVVKSRLDSQIIEQHVSDGQFVKKGDLLFTLDDRDIRAQIDKDEAAIARDEATHKRAENDLARYQQLLAKNAGTQQSVDQATADERSTAATILADRASLEADRVKLGYARITAPIDGRVGAVQVTPGNLVGANSTGTGLLTITQMQPLRVAFSMPESDLPVLRRAVGASTAVPVSALVTGAGGAPAMGTLNFVDSVVDRASGTIAAKAAFPNTDLALWPGQYVDVEIAADTLTGSTVIPTVAVQTGQKGPYVYVVKADETVELRQVDVALSDGGRTAVANGVSPGERVVTDGQMRLKQGTHIRDKTPGAKPAPAQDVPVARGERS